MSSMKENLDITKPNQDLRMHNPHFLNLLRLYAKRFLITLIETIWNQPSNSTEEKLIE